MFIDSHCHLDFQQFDPDRNDVISRAVEQDVTQFILPAVTLTQCSTLFEIARSHPQCSIALGLHPYFIEQHQLEHIDALDTMLLKNREQVCAVGETGLDKNCEYWQKQLQLFERQIQLAIKHSLPLIIHNRKSHQEILSVLKKYPSATGVIHGFSGSYQQAMEFIAQGFKLGIGGVITYTRANKTRQAVSDIPIESILLETDSPDMPVQGKQGQRNEPENIVFIFKHLQELRPESKETLQAQIFQNTLNLFQLKK